MYLLLCSLASIKCLQQNPGLNKMNTFSPQWLWVTMQPILASL